MYVVHSITLIITFQKYNKSASFSISLAISDTIMS